MFFNVQISIFNKSCKGRYDIGLGTLPQDEGFSFQFLKGTIRLNCYFNGAHTSIIVSIPQRYDTTRYNYETGTLDTGGFNSSKVRYDTIEFLNLESWKQFQFLKGTIRLAKIRRKLKNLFSFNSSKVRYD